MIDSCAFHPPISDEKKAMEKLWKLDEQEIIQLEIAEATDEEMINAPLRFRERLNSRICARDMANTNEEERKIREIRDILFPGKIKLTDSDKMDVRNVFVASKYSINFFVTCDKNHLLKKADSIKDKFNLKVFTPCQCLDIIEKKLRGDQVDE